MYCHQKNFLHSRIKLSSPPHFFWGGGMHISLTKRSIRFFSKNCVEVCPRAIPSHSNSIFDPPTFFFFTRFDSSHFLATENSVKKGIFSYFMSKGFIVQFQLNIRSPNSFFSNDSILHILQVPKVYEVKETFFSFYNQWLQHSNSS